MISIIVYTLVIHLTVTLGSEHCANEVIQKCESWRWKYKSCHVHGADKVTDVSVYSVDGGRCTKYETFGKSNDKIWVSDGCRAYFNVCYEKGRKVRYNIKIRTGNVNKAGTDADVTIQMLGEHGYTETFLLDDKKDNFERGMTDSFTLQAYDVGPIYEIKIGHDNSGSGPGWFLDEVTISKYLAKEEVLERMRKTQNKHRKKKEKLRIKRGETDEKKQEDSDLEPSLMSDSEDEDRKEKIEQRKLRLKSKREKSKKDRDDDEYEDLASRYKIPLYDVYHFTCKRWLATDEDDGLCMRILILDSTKTYFADPQPIRIFQT